MRIPWNLWNCWQEIRLSLQNLPLYHQLTQNSSVFLWTPEPFAAEFSTTTAILSGNDHEEEKANDDGHHDGHHLAKVGESCIHPMVGGFNPSEKYESQLGWLFPIYGKIQNVPNHQPDSHYESSTIRQKPFTNYWFTTTNHHYSPSTWLFWMIKFTIMNHYHPPIVTNTIEPTMPTRTLPSSPLDNGPSPLSCRDASVSLASPLWNSTWLLVISTPLNNIN